MTDNQRTRFYFPAWSDCVDANQWFVVKGRLQIPPERLTDEGREVVRIAQRLAAQAHRGVKLEDLRHAVHILALGRDKSSKDMTNSETDRVVAMFRLLQRPENIAARMAVQAYARGEDPGSHRRIEWMLKSAPAPYVAAIVANLSRGVTRDWQQLSAAQQYQLARIIGQRKRAKGTLNIERRTSNTERGAQKLYYEKKVHQPLPAAAADGDPDWSMP